MNPLDQQLIKACQKGDTHTARLLLQQGANPNCRDKTSKTPTIIAAENGHIPIITLLIQYGADPHIADFLANNALDYAVENSQHQTTEYLITQLGFDPNGRGEGTTIPFIIASQKGDIKMLQILAHLGANPHLKGYFDRTALHHAVEKGNHLITEYLITQFQLDPNTQDRGGVPPFLIAARKGDIDMLRLLAQLGADPYATDRQGRNALHYAVEEKHYDIAQYLITQLQVDPNSQDHQGITPFMIAAQNGDIKMLQRLIQHGANPHATDRQGRNALHYIAEKKKRRIAQYLITHLHLDPNQQDYQGNTPLHIALENGSIHTAQTLIQLGANPHIPNHQGETPMSIARLHRIRLPKIKPSTITL